MMLFELVPRQKECPLYAKRLAGTISDIANRLYDEYLTQGYSLTPEDITDVLMADVAMYAGWHRLDAGLTDDVAVQGQYDALLPSTSLLMDEWAVLSPVVRSHIDLVQARRMEGAGAVGVSAFGMSSSEALGYYQQAIEVMKKEAFVHGCWSV